MGLMLIWLINLTNSVLDVFKQVLGKIYAVLSDKDQRAVYDEQGVVDEELDALKHDRNWEEHWRRLFPKVRYGTLGDVCRRFEYFSG